ncbi:MAG: S8 family peptidase [Candidatus Latescibacteria bacterium]|nr:S8 family peptidase [Candidatus Latescibacterota bacterium]
MRGINSITVLIILATSHAVSADPYWVFFGKAAGWSPGDPVPQRYVAAVGRAGFGIRTVSRYFNAVSVDAESFPERLAALAGVERIEPVRSFATRRDDEPSHGTSAADGLTGGTLSKTAEHLLDYGDSGAQLDLLNVPALHDRGLSGRGVLIGVLDSGFDIGKTGALQHLDIVHTRNFITGTDDVATQSHGAYVLACIGGAKEGSFYGPAYNASFLLAATDHYATETRADEDRWVAAVEWCDSLGADIVSSSLVYNIFDTAEESYDKSDMDGKTSLVAQAAEIAFSHGILMVNSAGNEGDNSWGIITTPGDAEHVVAVGSVNVPDDGEPTVSYFSSRGPTADGRIKPDFVAPGENVLVPYPDTADFYIRHRGTSLAAPLVAGVCALILECRPEWTPADVVRALRETARDLGDAGPDNEYGWGLPDAAAACGFEPVTVGDVNDDAANTVRQRPFRLAIPFPNPFNAAVSIPVTVYRESNITAVILSAAGQQISLLADGPMRPGRHLISWNAAGQASGAYFVRIESGGFTGTARVLFVK